MTILKSRFDQVFDRIHKAELQSQRSGQVQLLAVSKTRPADVIREAYTLGQRHFGENYLQEALTKIQDLAELPDISWHFIGPIQSNKTRDIASHFHWVHSVDRLKIAKRLSEQRPDSLPPLNICLQVNISQEASKSGASLEQLPQLVKEVASLPNIRLRGLMAIPAPADDPDLQREPFAALAKALKELNGELQTDMDTLSMGMTDDLEAAVAEGATMVRIGTALFGARQYAKSEPAGTPGQEQN